MTGARCSQVDGLYVHPTGTSGPSIFMRIGTRRANVTTSAPASVSFA